MNKNIPLLLIIGVLAFGIRLPLLDNNYAHSFEADSEGGLEDTRSLYFFFKNPSISKPHALDGYPAYLDGNFVLVALTANFIRPLVKCGILDVELRDSDYSLMIFSHRWLSLIFSSLTAVLLFSCLLTLGSSKLVATVIMSLIFLFNYQQLAVDFMRVDHYLLFSFLLTFRSCFAVLEAPNSCWRWLLLGVSSAALFATKLNAPLYLVMVLAAMVLVLRSWASLFQFFAGFVPISSLLWINWILYPENAMGAIKEMLGVADLYFKVWTAKPYFLHHFHQFCFQGQCWQTWLLVLLVVWSLLVLVWSVIKDRRRDFVVLGSTFLAHSVYSFVTIKTDRYGIFFPAYYSMLIGAAYGVIPRMYQRKEIIVLSMVVTLLPLGIMNFSRYMSLVESAKGLQESLRITRLEPRKWLLENVSPGARIAYAGPRFTNPPIFDLPFKFSDSPLTYPYWKFEEALDVRPPTNEDLKEVADVLLLVDNYKQERLNELSSCPNDDCSVLEAWKAFYQRLYDFDHEVFSAKVPNYGVREVEIYVLNESNSFNQCMIESCSAERDEMGNISVHWTETEYCLFTNDVEVQISCDTTFNWLSSNTFDGWLSKYNIGLITNSVNEDNSLFIPKKLDSLLFEELLIVKGKQVRWIDVRPQVDGFFRALYHKMYKDSSSFHEAVEALQIPHIDVLVARINKVYGDVDTLRIREIEIVFNLTRRNYQQAFNEKQLLIPIEESCRPCFVRLRAKRMEWVLSPWGETIKVK